MTSQYDAISQLVAQFADAINRRDSGDFGAVWAGQARWRIGAPADFEITGSGADIAAAFEPRIARWEFFIQVIQGGVIDLDSDVGTGRWYLQEIGQIADETAGYRNHGVYQDRYVRTAAGWRFEERAYSYLYLDRSPLAGIGFGFPGPDWPA